MGGHILRGKGMVKFMRIAAAIAIAVALASCSKSEDGTETVKQDMTDTEIYNNEIKQHLTGTWVHDGIRNGVIRNESIEGMTVRNPQPDFEDSKTDTLVFDADGKATLTLGEAYWSHLPQFDGMLEPSPLLRLVIKGITVEDYPTVLERIVFSPEFDCLYLYNNMGNVTFRYRRSSN